MGAVMYLDKALKICIYVILVFTMIFPVGAFLLLPLGLMLAIAAGKSRRMLRAVAEDKTVILLLCSWCVSAVFSKLVLVSVATVGLFALQLSYLCLSKSVLDEKELQVWYRIINITAVFMCLVALFQFFSGHLNMYSSWVDQKSFGEIRRVYSTLYNPNIFAGFLVINLVWTVSRCSVGKADAVTRANAVLSSICLILTYSRGGFLAFCASMAVIFLFTRRKLLVLYVALMAAAFYGVNYSGAVNRFDYGTVVADSSNVYRLEIWKAGIKMFLERPLLGNGPGTAWVLLSTYSDKLFSYVLHAHNIFIQAAAETGIPGTAALLYFILKNAGTAVRMWQGMRNEEVSFVFLGFTASLAGIVVHGMVDAVIMLPSLSMIFIGYYSMYSIICKASAAAVKQKRDSFSFYEEEIA